MSTPILDTIETNIATLISGMTVIGGYNYNWGTVNEQDESIAIFPFCVINPTDSLADRETNVDNINGISSLDYTNEVLITLLCKGELPVFDNNPLFAIRSTLRKALDDLKMLFGTYTQLQANGIAACDNILYVASQIEPLARNDVQRPAQLRSMWKAVYAQDRKTPTQYASS